MSYSQLYLKSGFPRANACNGIGRYIGQLQRVTLKFCKTHGASRGLREFIENDLLNYAKENPGVVVYVKPRRHRGPVIRAEYLSGEIHWIPVHNYSRDEIVKYMELVRTQSSNGSTLRLRKMWHTEFPSIQGTWTPFTFRDPKLNTIEFPNDEIGACPKFEPTASEKIIQLFKEQQLCEVLEEQETSEAAKD
ncbi:large ribosomal subunit protein mL43 [Phymastichus coffea]|uniref:large ribosomal subunit protein mL43 n=1 Tax=Phymastichus coffea TaxID=108790 RepID=UPI00273C50C8|nr:large ribosomal subunit protein mL43 [Phymastichus coffea]